MERSTSGWQLVRSNTGVEAARHVMFELEAEAPGDEVPPVLHDARELEALAPGSEAGDALVLHMGAAPQARCIVTWEDSTGEAEEVGRALQAGIGA